MADNQQETDTANMTLGPWLTAGTIWSALTLYAISVTLMLHRRRPRWDGAARWAWTAGFLAMLGHLIAALHFHHDWAHWRAYEHTAERTRSLLGVSVGAGVYVNYAFVLVWLVDAAWWWLVGLRRYRDRRGAVDVALHAFFLFMIFNGAVLFETGPVRWFGLALLLFLAWRLVAYLREQLD